MSYVSHIAVQDAIFELENRYQKKYMRGNYSTQYQAAAVNFENATGLTRIAQGWELPSGLTYREYEYRLRQKYQRYSIAHHWLEHLSAIPSSRKTAAQILVNRSKNILPELVRELDRLKKLNPQLHALKIDLGSFFEVYHTLIGITSQYNVDDINAFILGKRKASKSKAVFCLCPHKKAKKKISDFYGVEFGWCPSAKTLAKIRAQILAKTLKTYVLSIGKQASVFLYKLCQFETFTKNITGLKKTQHNQ